MLDQHVDGLDPITRSHEEVVLAGRPRFAGVYAVGGRYAFRADQAVNVTGRAPYAHQVVGNSFG